MCLRVSWDVRVLESLKYPFSLLCLKLEDLSSFHNAAAEQCIGYHVSREDLEILPYIYFMWSIRTSYLTLPVAYQIGAACRESRQHALKISSVNTQRQA